MSALERGGLTADNTGALIAAVPSDISEALCRISKGCPDHTKAIERIKLEGIDMSAIGSRVLLGVLYGMEQESALKFARGQFAEAFGVTDSDAPPVVPEMPSLTRMSRNDDTPQARNGHDTVVDSPKGESERSGDAARMATLFASSDRAHYSHGEPYREQGSLKWEIKGTVKAKHGPVTVELWEQHLEGKYPLVLIPIRGDGQCLWGSIDVDEYDINPLELIARIERDELPLVPARSKSGGLHLFMFLREWTPAEDIRQALKAVAIGPLGLSEQVEIFPKQVALGNGEIGNGIAMPFLGTDFGGKIKNQAGLKKTGAEMLLAEFLDLAEDRRVTPAEFDELAQAASKRSRGTNRAAHTDSAAAVDHDAGIAHAARRLVRYAEELAAARVGERNNSLNKAAHEMGRMVGAGWIEQRKVEAELRVAAAACGLPQDEISSIIPRAVAEGKLKPPPALSREREVPIITCIADVPAREIEWLWPQRFALGKLSVIAGHPGLGKSQLTCAMAAAVTNGGPWPNSEGRAPRGGVLMLSAEDDVADTIRPRLEAAGAAVAHVHVLEAVRTGDGARRGFDLSRDVARLEEALDQVPDARLVVIDPLTAYLGKIDSHRAADIRGVLAPLQDLAQRLRVAVIGVSHLSKGGSNEALSRFIGSIGIVAAARAAFLVAKDGEDAKRRLFLPAKNNVGNDEGGIAFRIVEKPAAHPLRAPAVEWLEPVNMTADEAMAATANDERRAGKPDATVFLEDVLAGGPQPGKTVEERAAQRGISEGQLKRARKRLGVWAEKQGFGAGGWWVWGLPGQAKPAAPQLDLP